MPADLPQWVIDARRSVGDRIRMRRMHLNWTQERLCEAADLPRNTLQRMEAGEEMKISNLLLVAEALRIRAKDLL